MIKISWVCLFLSIVCWGNSQEKHLLSVTAGESAGKVAGCVDVISGSFYISETDALVNGALPIKFQHNYINRKAQNTFLGWFFFNHLQAHFLTATKVLQLHDSNGSSFLYKTYSRKSKRIKPKSIFESKKAKRKRKEFNQKAKEHNQSPYEAHLILGTNLAGLSNTSRNEISGRNNVKNTKVVFTGDFEYIYVHQPDGQELIYRKGPTSKKSENLEELINHESYYFLIEERFLTQKKLCYFYDDKYRLTEICSCNPDGSKKYAWIKCHYNDRSGNLDLETSDGRELKYRHNRKECNGNPIFYLSEVFRPDFPDEKYEYKDIGFKELFCVSERIRPNGRKFHIDYYQGGDNYVRGTTIHIGDSSDPRYGRVKSLKIPIGINKEPETVYEFIYEVGSIGQTGGKTYVYDARGNQSIYHYSSYFRLEKIERHDDEQIVQTEKFVWGKEGTSLEANLLCHSFHDREDQCFRAVQYIYDDFGNVTEEKTFGNLSGTCFVRMQFDENRLPVESAECSTIRKIYSQDGFNLLLKEEKENGQIIEYEYHPRTKQITAKFIGDQNGINIRCFYEYDGDYFLIKEICDDGTSKDPCDLGISGRFIKKIHRMESGTFVGMPDSIEERYLDPETGQEKLSRKVVLHYSKFGKVIQQDYHDSKEQFLYSLYYEYDHKGRLIYETNPIGQKASYYYDENNNCVENKDFSGKVTLYQDYDLVNRVICSKEISAENDKRASYFVYDKKSRLKEKTDYFGNTISFEYDSLGNQTKIQLSKLLDENKTVQFPTTTFQYDAFGNKISQKDPKGNQISTAYNSYNLPIKILYPDGGSKKFTYYLDGKLRSEIDPDEVKTVYEYDSLDRNTSKKIYAKNGDLLLEVTQTFSSFYLLSQKDPEGYVTSYSYNFKGEKISEEREGEKKEFIYDSLGREHKVITSDIVEVKEYDLLNRCIEERVENLEGQVSYKKQYEYDDAGNQCTVIDFVGNRPVKQIFYYDGFKRLITETNPFKGVTHYEYNEKYTNAIGQNVLQKIRKDPLGICFHEIYNSHGKVIENSIFDEHQNLLSHCEQSYDINGNIIYRIDSVLSIKEAQEQITYWDYDSKNQIISLTEAFGTKEQKATQFSYTLKGLLEKTVKPDGVVLTNTYDELDRLTSQKSSDGTVSYCYQYNLLSHLVSSTDEIDNSKTTREVDHLGRVLQERLSNGLTLQKSYDLAGRRKSIIFFDGSSIEYQYKSRYLSSIQRKNSFAYTHIFEEYDLAGNLLQEKLINNERAFFKRSPIGAIQEISSPYIKQKVLEYDQEGKILSLHFENKTKTYQNDYSYNGLKQLVFEKGAKNNNYAYDSLHNRIKKNASSYQINSLNQTVTTATTEYIYDLSGNLRKKIFSDSKIFYKYDALDRLVEVITPNDHCYYTYDSFHRRVSKTIVFQDTTSQIRFLYDDLNEIGSVDEYGNCKELRILGNTQNAERGSTIAIEMNGQVYIPVHDLFGSPKELLSINGAVLESYEHDVYGVEERTDFINPWRFSSKRIDSETNLIYFGRRYYDSEIGRWITADPKGYADGIINLYAYVLNSPLHNFDLYGLESLWMEGMKRGFRIEFDEFEPLSDFPSKKSSFLKKAFSSNLLDLLPKSVAYRGFENHLAACNNKNFSRCEWISRNESSHIFNYVINGILNTYEDANDNAQYFKSLSNKNLNIKMMYNASHRLFDILENEMNQIGFATTPSLILRDDIRMTLSIDKRNTINLFPFSHGNAVTYHSLLNLSAEEQSRINVFGFAPSKIITPELAKKVFNYASTRDFVPNTDFPYVRNKKYLTRLKCHEEANKFFDHEFQSPTFKETLEKRIEEYN